MAKAQHYVAYIKRRKDVTLDQIEETMNLSLDWYRVKEDLWVLYSTSDAEKWYSRLSPHVKEEGYVFICKLDLADRQGWMAASFWEWLRREHKS